MSTIRIKRRAAGGAAGAPASLANAELAFNEQDSVLYYGVGTGGAGGSATTVIAIGGPGAFALLSGATFTGAVSGVTAAVDDNTTKFATTAWFTGQKGTASPLVNGVAAAGTSAKWSPIDHIHPVDTSRAPVASPTFTGRVSLPGGSSTVAGGLILSSAIVKTSPVVGDSGGVEYDGTNVSVINGSGNRKVFAFTDGTIANATNSANAGVTDDAATATAVYPTWVGATSGNTSVKLTSTKLSFVPSTGVLSATEFSGSGASLTSLTAGNLSGTIPSGVLGNSSLFIGTTSVALNRSSGAISLTGVNIDGSAGSAATATNASQLGGVSAASYALLNSPTFTGSVNVPTATFGDNSTLAASTAFVQAAVTNAVQGLDPKASVKAATTSNLASLSGLLTIDGVSLSANDRVLVKDQTAQQDNGIYVAAAGSWTRALDMDSWNEVPGAYVFVEQGTTNKDFGFTCSSDTGGTLNTTPITWVQFAGAGSYTPGDGISISSNVVTAVGTTDRISVGVGGIDISVNYAGQTSIVTLGNVTSGTWSATEIGVTKGGLGLTAAVNGILKGNGATYAAAVADTDYLTPSSTLDGGTF